MKYATLAILCGLLTTSVLVLSAQQSASVPALVQQLGDDDFEKREEASAALEKAGRSVVKTLAEEAGRTRDPEVLARLRKIMEKLGPPFDDFGQYAGKWKLVWERAYREVVPIEADFICTLTVDGELMDWNSSSQHSAGRLVRNGAAIDIHWRSGSVGRGTVWKVKGDELWLTHAGTEFRFERVK